MKTHLFTTLKRWLSYIVAVPIEKTASAYNSTLAVSMYRGRIFLSSSHAIYSCEDLYDAFYHPFTKLLMQNTPLNKVLVLGLGLGAVPYMLEVHFAQNAHYTAVEIDPKVIALAQKYLPQWLTNKINFIEADAANFIAQVPNNCFDLIAVDIFNDTTTPTHFFTETFLNQLKPWLAASGYLFYNCLADTSEHITATDNFYNNVFKKVFPDAFVIPLADTNKCLVVQQ